MKRLFHINLLLLLIVTGCQFNSRQMEESFLSTVDSFYAAVDSGNQEGHANLFSNDVIFMPDDWAISRGEAVKESVKNRTGWVFRIKELNRLEYGISNDIGYTVNEYFYTWHAEGSQPEWHKTKNVHIWRLQDDNTWKLQVDIWNHTPE